MRKSAAFVFASLLATGCLPPFDPGNAPSTQNGSGGGTATGGGGGGATATDDLGSSTIADLGTHGDLGGAAGGDMAVACDSLQSTAGLSSPSGNHNAGQECQGCHAPGGGAPTFYLGGTLYNAVSGGAAVAGATLNVTDANGKKVKIVSANNGNFWTTTTLAFPIKVDASLCPATVPMVATVGGNGACNNCHNSAMRVHVP